MTSAQLDEIRGWIAEARSIPAEGNCVRRVIRMSPDDLEALVDSLASCQRELGELKGDKARLDWLAGYACFVRNYLKDSVTIRQEDHGCAEEFWVGYGGFTGIPGLTLRAAIDAAQLAAAASGGKEKA